MKDALPIRRAAAVVACAASLGAGATALAPGVASAQAGTTSCGSRSIAVKAGGKQLSVPVSRIRAEGVGCATAIKVIRGALLHNPPKGWLISAGSFKVPPGLSPHIAVNGRKKIEWAVPGA